MLEFFITFFIDHYLISLVWIFLFIALMYTIILSWYSDFHEISCHKAIQFINKEGFVIIDIRNQSDFYQGNIINSIHMSSADIRSSCARDLFKFQKKPLIVVCKDGVFSCSIARYLCNLGFEKVYVLKGGIIGWSSNNLPLVKKN